MDQEWRVGDVVLIRGSIFPPISPDPDRNYRYFSKHHITRKTPKRGVLDDKRQFWLESGRLLKEEFSLTVVLATDDLLAIYEEQEHKRAEKKQKAAHGSLLRRKACIAIDHMRIGHFHYCSDEQLEKVVAVFEEIFPHLYSQEEGRE